MMFFADFGKYSNSGPAIAVCLSVALLACLTLAPALLAACGERIFWPLRISTLGNNQIQAPIADADSPLPRLKPAQRRRGRAERFWQAAADVLLARPGMVLAAAVLSMAPLAWRGSSVAVTYDLLSELNPQRPSVHGTALLRRHFPPGETSPITVLVHRASGGFDQKEGEIEVAHLTKFLYELTDDAGQRIAARVRSVTEPLGDVPGYVQPFTAEGLFKLAAKQHPLTKERFVTQSADLAGRVARLDVILRCDPFSAEAIRLLDELEEKVYALRETQPDSWGNAEFYFTGVTAGIRDLRAVTESDQNRIQILVVIAVLAVLLVLLRSPLVCVFLILSVVWSYLVTLGLTELFFERLYGETYLGLDWKVPIFLFVILVAVGEDYNIYLVTRVLEEQQRLGPTAGLRAGLISTGGIITSCGVIMAGTFVSMTTGTLRGMIELGFALSLGVLLDTFVVRTVLVPAFLALMIRTSKAQPSTTDVRQSAESGVSPHEKRAS